MASELPQRHLGAARDGVRAPASRPAARRELDVLEPVDDLLLERVLEGLEAASAARRRLDVRSA